jgi:hypothetical protein
MCGIVTFDFYRNLRSLGHPLWRVRAHDSFLKCFGKYSDFKSLDSSHLAATGQGLEPQLLGPKPSVLPLDEPVKNILTLQCFILRSKFTWTLFVHIAKRPTIRRTGKIYKLNLLLIIDCR